MQYDNELANKKATTISISRLEYGRWDLDLKNSVINCSRAWNRNSNRFDDIILIKSNLGETTERFNNNEDINFRNFELAKNYYTSKKKQDHKNNSMLHTSDDSQVMKTSQSKTISRKFIYSVSDLELFNINDSDDTSDEENSSDQSNFELAELQINKVSNQSLAWKSLNCTMACAEDNDMHLVKNENLEFNITKREDTLNSANKNRPFDCSIY